MIAPSRAANGDVCRAARREAYAFGDRAAVRELEQRRSLGFAGQDELETAVTRVAAGRELELGADVRNVHDLDQQVRAGDRLAIDFDLVVMRFRSFDAGSE